MAKVKQTKKKERKKERKKEKKKQTEKTKGRGSGKDVDGEDGVRVVANMHAPLPSSRHSLPSVIHNGEIMGIHGKLHPKRERERGGGVRERERRVCVQTQTQTQTQTRTHTHAPQPQWIRQVAETPAQIQTRT